MKKLGVFFLIAASVILCLTINNATACATSPEHEPIIDVIIKKWEPGPDYTDPEWFLYYEEDSGKPKPESYQHYLDHVDPGAPDFERYGLNRYIVDFMPELVENEEDSITYRIPSFRYITGGWDGEREDPDHKAKISVSAQWITFCDQTALGGLNEIDEDTSDANKLAAYFTYLAKMNEHKQYIPDGLPESPIPLESETLEVINKIEGDAGEGYEWRSLELRCRVEDWPHGYSIGWDGSDYYDIAGADDSSEDFTAGNGMTYKKHTASFEQKEQSYYSLSTAERDPNDNDVIILRDFYYVPKGYDGCVVSLYDTRLAPDGYEDGKYIYDYMNENMLCFRLK